MDLTLIMELITGVGFPIACVIGLGWFVYKIYSDTTRENAENMEKVQARCKEREEKLFEEIKQNREVNASAIATIGLYADRLNHIEDSVEDMKQDISLIKDKVCS